MSLADLKRTWIKFFDIIDTIKPPGQPHSNFGLPLEYKVVSEALNYVGKDIQRRKGEDFLTQLGRNCLEARVEHFASQGLTLPEAKRLAFCGQ
jgi:hypothetical protein